MNNKNIQNTLLICLILVISITLIYLIYRRLAISGVFGNEKFINYNGGKRATRMKIYKSNEIFDPDEAPEMEDYDPDDEPMKFDPDQQNNLDDEPITTPIKY